MYSRKVEHVYQLVHRTIEFLTQQKHATAGNKSKDGTGDVNDDTSAGEVSLHYQFIVAQTLHYCCYYRCCSVSLNYLVNDWWVQRR